MAQMMRVGQGYDVHALVAGKPLILGGVEIPHDYGLLGHSDADVLLHAIIDALLGAAALGDIGMHFPDTDPKWLGVDSTVMLSASWQLIQKSGWELSNLDATIIAQSPRLSPFIPKMVARITEVLGVPLDSVNVKAKTNEKLGFVGRREAIVAEAVVLLVKNC